MITQKKNIWMKKMLYNICIITLINNLYYLLLFFFKGEFLLFNNFELITEVKFGGLLLEFGEFVFVFGNLFQGWFDAIIEKKEKTKRKC